jgi:hypothetical protein
MAEQSPDPWRLTWRFATSDGVLVALLLVIGASVTLTTWIPQQPTSDVDYAPWLSQMHARFGGITSAMRALGLFDVTSSLGFRAVLALLSASLFLRVIEHADRLWKRRQVEGPNGEWKQLVGFDFSELLKGLRRRRYHVVSVSSFFQVDRWPWSGASSLMAHAGGLLLLVGLLLSQFLGWQVEGLVLQRGERQSLPGAANWVALTGDEGRIRHSAGVVTFLQDGGPGVLVSASGEDGESLPLLLTLDAEPSTELRVALTEDIYFAIPEAELVVRLTPQSEDAYTRASVQVFNSPTGEIILERVTDKGGQATFDVEGVTLSFLPAPYTRVTATYNPGRIPALIGLTMVTVGVVGSLLWTERRFWLRGEGASTEVAGHPPSWLQRDEEVL